jgi:hypothetical protein
MKFIIRVLLIAISYLKRLSKQKDKKKAEVPSDNYPMF